ncbi:MAG: efflux RND transporter periplasmic adaptor subunit [Proteobacteria bacterium]|nr:efflux RND transporter periplasmic adaptor subunit [Pseudomonadota bacterium]
MLLPLVFGAVVLGAIVFLLVRNGPFAPVKVTQARVEQGALTPKIFGIGTVEARRSYLVGPTVASRVVRVLVDQGDSVRAGQLLAELDAVDLDERMAGAANAQERAASTTQASAALVREAKSRNELAAASAKRYADLRQKNFVSQEAVDAKQHEANAARAALEAAESQLAAARKDQERFGADRAGIVKQRAQYRLHSPVDGLISARDAEPGSTVVAGQAVLRLIDPASLWIKARIDQGRSGGIAVGQAVSIVLRSRPGQALPGKVARIEVASDSVTEERIVNVAFDKLPADFSSGELAEVTIALAGVEKALYLPAAAIRRVKGQAGVWRISDGKVSVVPVRTGVQTLDGQTQVLEGLAQGDAVVLHALQELRADEKVRVVESLK